jgi:2-polyprenyl-3-methyl-5-hydroxy-6-metoxy-1,4-benzoquinol methylase
MPPRDEFAGDRLRPLDFSILRPGMRVLDVGCGLGREMQRLGDLGCIAAHGHFTYKGVAKRLCLHVRG